MRLGVLAALPLVIYGGVLFFEWLLLNVLPHHFVFDPATLQKIVNDSLNSLDIDAPASAIMDRVYEGLRAEYPDYIAPRDPTEWVFNNAGNAMGSMQILHASLTEYLIFFGTAVGTEGHTGTHFADDYFVIMKGVEYAALPNATVPEKYLPGDKHHLPYGVNKQYSMPSGSWALELAQGYIPSMLPFGLIEVMTSTLDVFNFAQTARLTARHMVANMLKGKF